jgi:hypothetical protein
MEMSGQLHAPAALPRYPLDRRLGGPQIDVIVSRIISRAEGSTPAVVKVTASAMLSPERSSPRQIIISTWQATMQNLTLLNSKNSNSKGR